MIVHLGACTLLPCVLLCLCVILVHVSACWISGDTHLKELIKTNHFNLQSIC